MINYNSLLFGLKKVSLFSNKTQLQFSLVMLILLCNNISLQAQTIDVVDNNINNNNITDLHGYCELGAFKYELYWESDTVTDVQLINTVDSSVLVSGTSSPLLGSITNNTTNTPITVQLVDTATGLILSNPISLNLVDCSSTAGTTFTANGTYTVPAGITTVRFIAVGGGGGGGGKTTGSSTGKSGGGGGASASSDLVTIPGETFTITRGSRGSACLLYTSPSPRDKRQSRMPSSA